MGTGFPRIFSAPYSGETVRRIPQKFSKCKNVEVLKHHAKFHPPPGQPKTLIFGWRVCLLVHHAFERQRLCARFRREDEKALSVRSRETTKLLRMDRSRVSSQCRTSSDRYCEAVPRLMSNIISYSLFSVPLQLAYQRGDTVRCYG